MVTRRLLTPELLRKLEPPKGNEYWLADTQIRGFGVRVWARNGIAEFSYAVRKSEPGGRSVRRSLNLDAARSARYNSADSAFGGDIRSVFERDLASFLPEARQWARLEIAKITGKIESDEVLAQARKADAAYRDKVGRYVSELTLTRCVELTFESAKHRDWTQDYQDRLWRAYWSFDKATRAGELTVGQLANGVLASKINAAPIGFGNSRLLRSLLGIVADNLHALNGPPRGRFLPERLEPNASPQEEAIEFLAGLNGEDFDQFLSGIRRMEARLQSKLSIELAFHFFAPFSRILRGRWSQIIEDRWYPYGSQKNKYGNSRFERIEGPAAECLELAREAGAQRDPRSDFWFPADGKFNTPIKNVDRTWKRALREQDWPEISLRTASKFFNRVYYWRNRTHPFDRR